MPPNVHRACETPGATSRHDLFDAQRHAMHGLGSRGREGGGRRLEVVGGLPLHIDVGGGVTWHVIRPHVHVRVVVGVGDAGGSAEYVDHQLHSHLPVAGDRAPRLEVCADDPRVDRLGLSWGEPLRAHAVREGEVVYVGARVLESDDKPIAVGHLDDRAVESHAVHRDGDLGRVPGRDDALVPGSDGDSRGGGVGHDARGDAQSEQAHGSHDGSCAARRARRRRGERHADAHPSRPIGVGALDRRTRRPTTTARMASTRNATTTPTATKDRSTRARDGIGRR